MSATIAFLPDLPAGSALRARAADVMEIDDAALLPPTIEPDALDIDDASVRRVAAVAAWGAAILAAAGLALAAAAG